MLRTSSPNSFVLTVARFRSSFLSLPSNSGSHTALYPFTLPGGNCIEGRSARGCGAWAASEERIVEEVCTPFVVDISTEWCAARGLSAFEEEESEVWVSGVRPLASDDALFWAPDCEPWLNTEEGALFKELVEPAP